MKKTNIASIVINNFINDNRVLKEAITLSNDYNVTIVAVHEDGLAEYENVDDVKIHRVKLKSRNWSKNKLIKLIKYIELTYRVAKQYKNVNILHCNDLDALFIGWIIKQFFNKNIYIVYDAHEYETERNRMHGLNKMIAKLLEKFLIKYVNKTLTVSNAIADEYVKMYDIRKPELVLNCPEYIEVSKKDIFRKTFNIAGDSIIFLYQGSLGPNRGVEVILEVFKKFKDNNKVIVFMGYGPLVELIETEAQDSKNIYYHNAVNRTVLIDYTASADFGISLIENSCLSHYYCLPNKMFEYIMAEIPVIVSNLPEMAKMVKENNIGYVAENDTLEALSKVINTINFKDINIFKANLKKIKSIYNWEEQEKNLLHVYHSLGSKND